MVGARLLKKFGHGGSRPDEAVCDEMSASVFRSAVTLLIILAATGALSACGKSGSPSAPGASTASQGQANQKPRTDFEQKLQYVRDGQFAHIYVFTRRDGGAFDREDVAYLNANSPEGEKTNMRVKTDDGSRVLVGTNFEFTQANFDTLGKRFNIEDYTGR
jgi:predicted small lipoprotein YifL